MHHDALDSDQVPPNNAASSDLTFALTRGADMSRKTSRLFEVVNHNIGRCPRCMKIAFLCASTSWLAYLIIQFFWPQEIATRLVIALPIGLTALWMLHFTTYTARVLAALRSEYIAGAPSRARAKGESDASRRDLLWVFGNALTLGFFASVWLPSTALAAGRACGTGRHCPDSAPNCCSRSQGKCCNGNWACSNTGTCHTSHSDARAKCGQTGTVLACT